MDVGRDQGSPRLGTLRGLRACATDRGKFAVLALDHRQNLRRLFAAAGLDGPTHDQAVELKLDIVASLASSASAVLLDPELSVGPAIATGVLPARGGLIVALEATGYDGPATDRRTRILDGWSVAQVKRSGASAVKLLLYYHPDAASSRLQEALLRETADECRAHDIALVLEPITFSVRGSPLVGDERREVIVETARRLTAIGGDILKAEFPGDADRVSEEGWLSACQALDAASRVPWVILSAGASDDDFRMQAQVACAAGASGVMVGRSVWGAAVGLDRAARRRFLDTEARQRLDAVTAVVDGTARPWEERSALPASVADLGEGWYRRYGR
jgi:tagatose-1,6-bisphosphate aldolase